MMGNTDENNYTEVNVSDIEKAFRDVILQESRKIFTAGMAHLALDFIETAFKRAIDSADSILIKEEVRRLEGER